MAYTLITGASSGIGKALAYQYAQRGYDLILVARSSDKLEHLAETLSSKYSIKAQTIALDLSKANAAKELYEEVNRRNLTLHTLVNNAGFALAGLFHTTDYAKQQQEIQLNITTLTELTYLFLPQILKATNGVIINIASAAALITMPYVSVYSATKAFVLSFTQGLAYEYADSNVHFIAVCPGATDTHFFDGINKFNFLIRTPEDVARSVFRVLKHKNKVICTDGLASKFCSFASHIASRKLCVNVMGILCKKTWGQS